MSVSARVRPEDVGACYRLVGSCRDLGADVDAWQLRLLEGIRPIVGAQVAIGGNMLHFGSGRTARPLGTLRTGWATPDAERAWCEYASQPVERTPEYRRLASLPGPLITCTRDDLWDRVSWYRSATYNERHRVSGIDHYIISIHGVPGTDLHHSLWLHRAVGERSFSRREVALVRLVHAELGAMIGSALASALEPRLAALPARRRQVLDRLLAGDSEKQAAAALGVSAATVHEHVAALHRHFGVTSRGELLARFIGRARPPEARGPRDGR